MRKIPVFAVTIAALLFLSVNACFAGIVVAPDKIETTAKQKETIKGIMVVENRQETSASIKVYSSNWFKQKMEPETWLTIEPNEFVLKAGEQKRLKYTVLVPENVTGELMGMVFVNATPEKGPIGLEMSVPFYVAIEGTTDFKVDILRCYLSAKDDVLDGIVSVQNNGNVHVRPDVKVLMTNDQDRTFYYTGYVQYGRSVRPGDYKSFPFTIKDVKNIPKKCNAKVVVSYGWGRNFENKEEKSFEVEIMEKQSQNTPIAQ